MIRTFYLLRLTQQSPLRISSGNGEQTDNDLVRDARGFPYIPGSSLAGVLRSMLPEKEGNLLFGTLEDEKGSSILVSDAVLHCSERDFTVSVRDGVGLDDNGVAEDTKKYDFEVLECSSPYQAVLEVDGHEDEMSLLLREIAAEGGLRLGGRTTRGYGHMLVEIRKREFRFPNDLEAWLDWNPFGVNAWNECLPVHPESAVSVSRIVIQADLSMQGSFAIGSFVGDGELNSTFLTDRNGNPVIPGTSWAGVFRHHMRSLAREMRLDDEHLRRIDLFFGKQDEKEGFVRSRILFSETVLSGGMPYRLTRVGVDRFTAAPSNGKLFMNEYCEGGTGVLTLQIPRNGTEPWLEQLLVCCLLDLHHGILHIGGEGSVGRGCAAITRITIDGIDCTQQLQQNALELHSKEVASV